MLLLMISKYCAGIQHAVFRISTIMYAYKSVHQYTTSPLSYISHVSIWWPSSSFSVTRCRSFNCPCVGISTVTGSDKVGCLLQLHQQLGFGR